MGPDDTQPDTTRQLSTEYLSVLHQGVRCRACDGAVAPTNPPEQRHGLDRFANAVAQRQSDLQRVAAAQIIKSNVLRYTYINLYSCKRPLVYLYICNSPIRCYRQLYNVKAPSGSLGAMWLRPNSIPVGLATASNGQSNRLRRCHQTFSSSSPFALPWRPDALTKRCRNLLPSSSLRRSCSS